MRGKYQFKVRSYECGPDGRVTLPTICNFLKEAASLHAASLGFGKGDFAAADGFTYHRVSAPDGKDHIVARTKG